MQARWAHPHLHQLIVAHKANHQVLHRYKVFLGRAGKLPNLLPSACAHLEEGHLIAYLENHEEFAPVGLGCIPNTRIHQWIDGCSCKNASQLRLVLNNNIEVSENA